MIIKPNKIDGFADLGKYLAGEGSNYMDNEECNFIATGNSREIDNIHEWCEFGDGIAETKRRLRKPIEHISIRTRDGDILTPRMMLSKVPELLEALVGKNGVSYKNCPWVLVEHRKRVSSGQVESHYHLAICCVDNQGRIPHPYYPKLKCINLSYKFALDFGFRPVYENKNANPYFKKRAELVGLWADTKDMPPLARLLHFIKNDFICARGNRGQLLFVDLNNKQHSPQLIPATKTAKMREKEIIKHFGIDAGGMKTLPHISKVLAAVSANGWKPVARMIMKGIAYGLSATARYAFYQKYGGNNTSWSLSLSHMRPRYDSGLRLQGIDQSLSAQSSRAGFRRPKTLQPAAAPARRRAFSVGNDGTYARDPTLSSRAAAAGAVASARFDAAIEDVYRDPSFSAEDKTARIAVLRQQQGSEAAAAQERVMEQEKPTAQARTRDYSALKP